MLRVALALALAASPAPPVPLAPPAPPAPERVILVTLDGARWQDVIGARGALFPGEHPLMPALTARVASSGVMWTGARAMTSSLAPVSLPGYQTLMVGRSPCIDNKCARVTDETLPERVARELALPPAQVAVFASWSKIARAATARDGAVLVDAPPDGPARGDRGLGETGPPWDNARYDRVTAERALAHLEEHRPRFLWLALLDMDEHAHARDKRKTVDALKDADRVLARIFAFVDALPADERARTTVIVTADHGRGPGLFWFDHRAAFPAAREIFVAAVGASVRPLGVNPSAVSTQGATARVTQADVRPTIERLLGLTPTTRHGGAPILEIAP